MREGSAQPFNGLFNQPQTVTHLEDKSGVENILAGGAEMNCACRALASCSYSGRELPHKGDGNISALLCVAHKGIDINEINFQQ